MEEQHLTARAPFAFINLCKEAGRTSTRVGSDVRRMYQEHFRVGDQTPSFGLGHIGTLDPQARGVLPLALGKATRLIPMITDRRKCYTFALVLGTSTVTGDAGGLVRERENISSDCVDKMHAILPKFIGTITQLPPMVSAVHHKGKRLYELARQGVEVERKPREVEIISIDILNHNVELDGETVTRARVYFRVHCAEGTYIRSLCEDMALAIGTRGHMDELVRERSGPFHLESAVSIEQIQADPNAVLIDPREIVPFRDILLEGDEAYKYGLGQWLPLNGRGEEGERVFISVDEPAVGLSSRRILGIADCEKDQIIPQMVFG